jgi:hypothetical protein
MYKYLFSLPVAIILLSCPAKANSQCYYEPPPVYYCPQPVYYRQPVVYYYPAPQQFYQPTYTSSTYRAPQVRVIESRTYDYDDDYDYYPPPRTRAIPRISESSSFDPPPTTRGSPPRVVESYITPYQPPAKSMPKARDYDDDPAPAIKKDDKLRRPSDIKDKDDKMRRPSEIEDPVSTTRSVRRAE